MDAHPSNTRALKPGSLRAIVVSAGAVAAGVATLAGCGADPEGYNEADVAFATNMSQHHAQTVELVNLPLRHDVASEDAAWTDDARARRFQELKKLTALLEAWEQPVPETGLEHADEGKHVVFDARIPGVLTEEQVHSLEQAAGGSFTQAWLEELIRHEKGAVEMAEAQIADGQNAEAIEMAREDKAAHEALVAELERLADRS